MPTSLPPSISANAALIKGVPSNSGAGGATQVPPGILALPSGTVLRGTISQIDGRGNAILSTAKGDVSLHTDLAIKLGSDVALRLTTSSEGVKARILSINGMSPKEFAEKSTIPRGQQIHIDDIVQTDKSTTQAKSGTATSNQQAAPRNALPPTTTATANPALTGTTTDAAGLKPLPLQAVILSRSEQAAPLLRALPAALNVTAQTLQSGAALQVKLLPASVSLPNQAATVSIPASTAPGTGNTAAATPSPSGNPATPTAATPPATPGAAPPNNTAATIAANTASQTPNPAGTTTTAQAPPTGTPATPASTAPASGAVQNTTPLTPAPSAATGTNPPSGGSATPGAPPAPPASTPAAPGAASLTPNSATVAGGNTPAASTPAATPSTVTPGTSPAAPTVAGGTTTPPTTMTTPATTTATPNTTPATGQPSLTPPAAAAAPASSSALPPLPAPTSAQLQSGIIPAQIIGHEPSGDSIVRTALGTMRVSLPGAAQQQNWPTGTQFELQIERPLPQANTANTGSGSPASTQPASLSELSMQWRSLQEAMDVLQQIQPAIAAQIRDQIIPKPGQKMAASMLFFLSALRGGNLRQWLGDKAVDALEQQQRGDLVKKLTTEFGTLRQFFTDSPSPNWQAVFAPVFDEHHWQQARLFLRKEPEGKEGESFGTRFVMELELSRMGPMQLDGLVRKQRRTTQFDLTIRTTTPLAESHQRNIREIYQNAAEISGFEGHLQFQKTSPFPVLPMRDIIADVPDVLA